MSLNLTIELVYYPQAAHNAAGAKGQIVQVLKAVQASHGKSS